MTDSRLDERHVRVAAAFVAGVMVCLLLVTLCHRLAVASAPTERGYEYSQALTGCYLPVFVIGGPLAALLAAPLARRAWPFALGIIAPFGGALVIEMIRDPSGHTLFPLEIAFYWAPAFLLSWGAGAVALAFLRLARAAH